MCRWQIDAKDVYFEDAEHTGSEEESQKVQKSENPKRDSRKLQSSTRTFNQDWSEMSEQEPWLQTVQTRIRMTAQARIPYPVKEKKLKRNAPPKMEFSWCRSENEGAIAQQVSMQYHQERQRWRGKLNPNTMM